MIKIAIKTFRHGRWEFRSCFLGVALCVAELFAFLAINSNMFSQTATSLYKWAVLSDALYFYYTFAAVTVLGIYYSLKTFFIRRIKDYRVLFLLGSKASSLVILILTEYLIGTLIAVVEGLLLGNAIYLAVRYFIGSFSQDEVWRGYYVGRSYTIVIVLSLITALVVGVLYILKYAYEGVEHILLNDGNQDYFDKMPSEKNRLVQSLIGILLITVSVFSFKYMISNVHLLVLPYITASIGLPMFMYPIICTITHKKIKGRDFIYDRLLQLPLLEKYRTQMYRIIVIVAIDIFAMGYVAVVISNFVPVRLQALPYDAVIMTSDDHVADCNKLVTQYSGTSNSYPMIRVTDWYGTERIGISQDTYRQLGGECDDLRTGEMIISLQNQHTNTSVNVDFNHSYTYDTPYFYPGRYSREYTWDDLVPEYKYDIIEVKYENLIGQWLVDTSNDPESLVVFSDNEFNRIRNELLQVQDEPSTLMLLRFDDGNSSDAYSSIKSNASAICPEDNNTNGQRNWYTANIAASEITRYRSGGLAEMIILLLVLLLSTVVQIVVGNISDQTYYRRRLRLLSQLGLPDRTIKHMLRFWSRVAPDTALAISLIGAPIMRSGLNQWRESGMFVNDRSGWIWLINVIAYIAARLITTGIIIAVRCRTIAKKEL